MRVIIRAGTHDDGDSKEQCSKKDKQRMKAWPVLESSVLHTVTPPLVSYRLPTTAECPESR